MKEVFARVVNDKLVEYPVTRTQLVNRNERAEYFMPVKYDRIPLNVPAYHFAKEVPEILQDHVQIHYQVVPFEVEQLLIRVHHDNGILNNPKDNVTVATVDPALFKAVIDGITRRVQERLDNFARERNYDSIVSAITYKDSPIEQFRQDAARCAYIRDTTWGALYTYLNNVSTGAAPVPKNIDSFFSLLPATTW